MNSRMRWNDVHSIVMKVTPELASQWLEMNRSNRKPSAHVVTKYAIDMKNGSWKLNGEAIKIGEAGELLDGQHRCMACVQSGVEFESIVVFNVKLNTQETMDSGRSRTLADQLKMRGESNYTSLAATARGVMSYEHGSRLFKSSTPFTISQILEWLDNNPSVIDSALVGRKTSLSKIGISSGVGGTLHYIFTQIDEGDSEDADEFFKLVLSPAHDEGSPILALRETLRRQKDRNKGSALSARWVAGVTIKAWNRWRAGDSSPSYIRFKSGGAEPETFPVPN